MAKNNRNAEPCLEGRLKIVKRQMEDIGKVVAVIWKGRNGHGASRPQVIYMKDAFNGNVQTGYRMGIAYDGNVFEMLVCPGRQQYKAEPRGPLQTYDPDEKTLKSLMETLGERLKVYVP